MPDKETEAEVQRLAEKYIQPAVAHIREMFITQWMELGCTRDEAEYQVWLMASRIRIQ